jgi:hypothetical protein
MAVPNFHNPNTPVPEGNGLVQVLQTLITSVDGLRNEITQLRRDNAELKRVQENNNVADAFRLFPKLPLEIREMIWKLALAAPQIHIIGEDQISRSKTIDVMQTCSEARRCGLSLKLPYYKIGEGRIRGAGLDEASEYKFQSSAPRYYMNLDVDTIWNQEKNMQLPRSVQFHCGLCDEQIFTLREAKSGLRYRKLSNCSHKVQLDRLAINHAAWWEPTWGDDNDPFQDDGCVELLKYSRAREVILVVGDTGGVKDPNVRFVYPSGCPMDMLHSFYSTSASERASMRRHPNVSCHLNSWDLASQRTELKLKAYKDGLAERKRLEIEAGEKPSRLSTAICNTDLP